MMRPTRILQHQAKTLHNEVDGSMAVVGESRVRDVIQASPHLGQRQGLEGQEVTTQGNAVSGIVDSMHGIRGLETGCGSCQKASGIPGTHA